MAHFAEIRSDNNEVIRVIVVNDSDVVNNGGNLSTEAETWVANNHPNDIKLMQDMGWSEYPNTYWKQCSKQRLFRKNYPGYGYTYDENKDKFLTPKPYTSWSLNENDDWQAPINKPKQYIGSDPTLDNVFIEESWDEDNQRWTGIQEETSTNYIWNTSSLEWEVDNG
jgi:hypothetical protein